VTQAVVIVGFSGFEDLGGSTDSHLYQRAESGGSGGWFRFHDGAVPLQFFPLHLIGHDASAALLVDGRLVACGAEERFTRIKHGFNLAGHTVLPRRAVRYCLEEAKLTWDDVDYWVHYCEFTGDSVRRRLERVARALSPQQRAMIEGEHERAYCRRVAREVVRRQLEDITGRPIAEDRFIQVRHHLAHAAGAFYSSGFDEAICLTLDGYGEEESSIWAIAGGTSIRPEGSVPLPASLGMVYQIVTAYLGFRAFGDEYKVMGMSAYGDPKAFKPVFDEAVELLPNGAYSTESVSRVDLDEWLWDSFGDIPDRGSLSRKAADIAAGLQGRLEEAELHTAEYLKGCYGIDRLCVSGGVGLNACANGAIVRSGLFNKVFVQPAASDDGASLGAALYAWHEMLGGERRPAVPHVYWGPAYGADRVEDVLQAESRLRWEKPADLEGEAARLLAAGKIVGWFQGRMEIGPRALGARSILASPTSIASRDRINELIKQREPFRPFAPSVLAREAPAVFVIPDQTSARFMTVTYETRDGARQRIPAVVHVDGSARIQMVYEEDNPRFHRLLERFHELTDVPVLLNTSFNRAGEPIVRCPEDAINCFLESGLDALVVGDCIAYPAPERSPAVP
jgi:carbamoyltransferase